MKIAIVLAAIMSCSIESCTGSLPLLSSQIIKKEKADVLSYTPTITDKECRDATASLCHRGTKDQLEKCLSKLLSLMCYPASSVVVEIKQKDVDAYEYKLPSGEDSSVPLVEIKSDLFQFHSSTTWKTELTGIHYTINTYRTVGINIIPVGTPVVELFEQEMSTVYSSSKGYKDGLSKYIKIQTQKDNFLIFLAFSKPPYDYDIELNFTMTPH